MSSQTIQTMSFTQIIAFKGYLENLGKPLNSTLNSILSVLPWSGPKCPVLFMTTGAATFLVQPVLTDKWSRKYSKFLFLFINEILNSNSLGYIDKPKT